MPSTLWLAWRNLRRHPLRNALTVGALAIALFCFAFLRAFLGGLLSPAEAPATARRLWVRSAVSLKQPLPVGIESRIGATPGVELEGKVAWFGGRWKDPKYFFANFAVDADKLDKIFVEHGYPADALRDYRALKNGAIIGPGLTRDPYNWKVGDAITLTHTIYPADAELKIVGVYQPKAGSDAKVRYVPMAADPWIFRPTGAPTSPRLLFVGSAYADRAWLLDRCAEVLPVSMHGQGHDLRGVARGLGRELLRRGRVTPPLQAARMLRRAAARTPLHVSDEEYVRLAATHGVSVGFSEVVQERTGRLLRKVRLREYEATMAGLCHLAWPLPELQRGFDGGRELLFYEGEEQITDLLRQIKGGAIDFRAVGRAARARAERDHTWTVRLRAALCG